MINPTEVLAIAVKLGEIFDKVDANNPAEVSAVCMSLDLIHSLEKEKFVPKMDQSLRKMLLDDPSLGEMLPPGEAERILERTKPSSETIDTNNLDNFDFEQFFFKKDGPVS